MNQVEAKHRTNPLAVYGGDKLRLSSQPGAKKISHERVNMSTYDTIITNARYRCKSRKLNQPNEPISQQNRTLILSCVPCYLQYYNRAGNECHFLAKLYREGLIEAFQRVSVPLNELAGLAAFKALVMVSSLSLHCYVIYSIYLFNSCISLNNFV